MVRGDVKFLHFQMHSRAAKQTADLGLVIC